MNNWQDVENELLKNPSIKRVYDALEPQFELANQLISARRKRGLTQSQLAEKIGTKQPAIARLESGEYNASIKLLRKVAEATGTRLTISFEG
jgi:DNA-binding XRE family transcriptional regulator